MLAYIELTGIDDPLRKEVILYAERHKTKVQNLAEKFATGNQKCLVNQNDLTRLAVVLEALKFTKKKYDALNIDEKIFRDTVKDIGIWCENNSNKGLKNYPWIKNHVNAELFKIGRLQFQLYKCNNITLNYKRLPFHFGDNLIYIHIPQGEKLIYDNCVESIQKAKAFFSAGFPHYNYRYFFCESWLLYDGNKNFMKADSNIMRFSKLFNIAYSVNEDFQAIERIFGKRQIFKSKYPEYTSLQKSAKEYIMNGGKLGIGIGYIDSLTVR